jgi:hypothetical protein
MMQTNTSLLGCGCIGGDCGCSGAGLRLGDPTRVEASRGAPSYGPSVGFTYNAGVQYPLAPAAPIPNPRTSQDFAYGRGLYGPEFLGPELLDTDSGSLMYLGIAAVVTFGVIGVFSALFDKKRGGYREY